MKRIIKKVLPKSFRRKCRFILDNYSKGQIKHSNKDKIIYLCKNYFKYKFYKDEKSLLKSVNIFFNNNYIYGIDWYKRLKSDNYVIGNNSIDYSKILNNSLNDFRKESKNIEICNFIDNIEYYLNRIIKKIKRSNINHKDELLVYFNNIKNKKCEHYYEALQRILFYNQLLWQFGHNLNGLGRLDKILGDYYYNDINSGYIDKENAKELLKDFCLLLNKDYIFKSSSLIGDTGQLIIIGGKEMNGDYFYNDITLLLIEIIKEIKKPDPKLLLRVSKNIPIELLKKAIKCIGTGVGSPLLSNDDQIIDRLISFGYDKKDAYNYASSACWEPLIPGKSLDPNNMNCINFLKPFNDLFNNEDISNYNFEDIEKKYFNYLEAYLVEVIDKTNEIEFEKSNIFSLLIDDCLKKNIDISKGGAKYNNYGLTSVGLSSVVNSLLNIKKYVYEEKKYNIEELNKKRLDNFVEESVINDLKNNEYQFGVDEEIPILLTNKIVKYTSNFIANKENKFGGKYKFGFSSPNYITSSRETNASFDGRRDKEAFSVHISSMHVPFIELVQFASKLDYPDNGFNGGVIDFVVTPTFIDNNIDQFTKFIYKSIENGFFQMQMNVVSSKLLINARKNPSLYPNLIVRVWGFSAYFNELPDEYKDLLIERAKQSENNC